MLKRKQVIVTLASGVAILGLVLLHILLSKNIGPLPVTTEKILPTSEIVIYDTYE